MIMIIIKKPKPSTVVPELVTLDCTEWTVICGVVIPKDNVKKNKTPLHKINNA